MKLTPEPGLFQIREEAIMLKLKHVIKEQTDILTEFKKLNPVDDRVERESKLKRLRDLKREEDRIRALSDDELFDDIYEDYDWMKISAQCFDAAISPESCRLTNLLFYKLYFFYYGNMLWISNEVQD